MKFSNNSDEEDRNDFFDGPDLPDPQVEEKQPAYKSDDPRYWDQEEEQWEYIKPKGVWKTRLCLLGGLIVVVLLVAGYLRYFTTYVDDATEYGYIESVEKRGVLFKTYEGVLIPYKDLMDDTREYSRDFLFSTRNKELGSRLMELEKSGEPIRVTYCRYYATMPWRGSSKIIVTAVDSVDPRKILPSELMPEYLKNGN
jgi:hypothetical protein